MAQSLVAPASTAMAQTSPWVTFSPSTVAVGDTLTVNGAGFEAEPSISGTAACNLPPLTPFPNAFVTIFSGNAQVASTRADGKGNWSLFGTAPNATYIVRYTNVPVEGPATTCGVSVTTAANGSATVGAPDPCPNPDNHNRVWNDASSVPALDQGVLVSDAICHANESRWYKVQIRPGQRVTAQIDNPSFDLSLGLYKDIQQVSDAMTAATSQPGGLGLADLQRFTASIPHDVAAPDATAPDATAPDATAPDATAPDATAPDATAPDATAPDATAPDATAPDATAPDATAPDATAATYSAALSTSLIAFSDKPGLSPEFVRRHTWDNTGNFYIRVRGHNGAFDETHPFMLKVTVVNHNCTTSDAGPINLNITPFSEFEFPAHIRTLILTNTGPTRFPAGSDTAGMLSALNAFAARPEINGFVLDLANNPGLAADYQQWDEVPQCAPAANIVANQIRNVVNFVRATDPALQYVVIAGGDRVIPFARIVDQAGLSNEVDYSPAVLDASESQAVLKTGYFLSQDLYGSFTRISLRDHDFDGFDIPVGRLVENPPEIQTMLNAYAATGGVIRPASALISGYDFLANPAQFEAAELGAGGVTVDTLIEANGKGPKDPSAWTADALRGKLFGSTHFDVLDLNAHFSGNTLLAADDVTRIRSGEIASVTDSRYRNSLVMSMGCHSGYNIVDNDATPGTPPVDWAQAFAMQGATLIGGTGYQYGDTVFIKYSAQLLDSVTHELRLFDGATPDPVPIGQAIVNAKRAYIHAGMNGIDEKSVAELTLYGLPMMGVSLPSGRIPRPGAPPPVSPTRGTSDGLFFADLAPNYTLTPHEVPLSTGDGSTVARFFDATLGSGSADVQTVPGQPTLPRVLTDATALGVAARGVVLMSANYVDTFNLRPLVDAPSTEVRSIRPAYASSIFAPTQIVSLAEFQGQSLVELPLQFRSNSLTDGSLSVLGTMRRYDSLATRVYYSNRSDASALGGPPIIYSTTLTNPSTNILAVDVAVGGLSAEGLEDVFATFTAERNPDGPNPPQYGTWTSKKLTRSTSISNGIGLISHFTGTIDLMGTPPQRVLVFVQAVSGTGLVSLATNNGSYYQFVQETATLGAPKLSTSLALTQSTYTAPYRSNLTVSALLTNAVTHTPISGKTVTFTLGRSSTRGTTGSNGVATATLPVLVAPDSPPPRVTAGFAEDPGFLGSGDSRDVTITRATTFFDAPASASMAYGDAAIVATLKVHTSSGDKPLREMAVNLLLPDGRQLDTLTDGYGQVLFDTEDFQGVQPGTYPTTITFNGNDRYAPTSSPLTQTVIVRPGGNHSVAFNGVGGFVEAPQSPDLNITGDWTLEAWFKDEDPNGFNHDFRQILAKGDRNANGEAPYFALVGFNHLLAGVRTGGQDYPIDFDLAAAGLSPAVWHHVAVTFRADLNVLNLWVDGQHISFTTVPAHSSGNTLPVEIGRGGPSTGKYWMGKLDDVRIWNVARTGADITATFGSELSNTPAGLVANWKFNERLGTLAAYSSVGTHTAILSTTGAAFSTDVHP